NLRENIRFFILIEPGMGYLVPALRKNNPQARIIALHVSDFFITRETGGDQTLEADAVWSPGRGMPVQRFLEEQIPDMEARFIGLIEWRPSLAVYGEDYRRLLTEAADFIKRIDANTRTVKGFGRRWFKNVFKNLTVLHRILEPVPFSTPLVVTGAGPSLEEAIPLIRERKKTEALGVLAAASSAEALAAGGILPDLVISTDGGGWAPVHLRGALRKRPPALAVTLHAALPAQCGDLPTLVVSDGSLWQNLLLKSMAIPFIPLSSRGTVTASALDLALVLTRGEIFIAGTDLSHRDLCTHARPYSFNRLMELRASRFHPLYSQAFVRAGVIAASGSLEVYAAWFGRQVAAYPNRLRTLGSNNPVFNSLGSGKALRLPGPGGTTPAAKERFFFGGRITKPSFSAEHALKTLLGALGDPALAPSISGELSPLLRAEEEDPSPRELIAIIRSLTEPYFSGRRGIPDG
ncbi:MAG: DUF115 domain-containing protein, partial [Treponema sp.]|nr:DUF115 domain-containing protein [Treponema sp.]